MKIYLRVLALFWATFGLITIFYPRFMELFMTDEGEDATTGFTDNLWMHDGLDILAVTTLLLVLSTLTINRTTLIAAGVVSLKPAVAIMYSVFATPYWSALFLLPASAAVALGIWGFILAVRFRAHVS